jgi:hypothetical protein
MAKMLDLSLQREVAIFPNPPLPDQSNPLIEPPNEASNVPRSTRPFTLGVRSPPPTKAELLRSLVRVTLGVQLHPNDPRSRGLRITA